MIQSILGFFIKTLICGHTDSTMMLSARTPDIDILNKYQLDDQDRHKIYCEVKLHLKELHGANYRKLPIGVIRAIPDGIIGCFGLNFDMMLLTSLMAHDFNDEKCFENVTMLDPARDYAESAIFNAFFKLSSDITTHYQILLNSQWFLDKFNEALSDDKRNPMKILKGLLDLNYLYKADDEELRLKAFTIYAKALLEYYRMRHLANKFGTAIPFKVNLFDTHLVKYYNNIIYKEIRMGGLISQYAAFDLEKCKVSGRTNYFKAPKHAASEIESHGNIIIVDNKKAMPLSYSTTFNLNGDIFSLYGGQSTIHYETNWSIYSIYHANVLKENKDGTVELIRYFGMKKEVIPFQKNDVLTWRTLYFKKIK